MTHLNNGMQVWGLVWPTQPRVMRFEALQAIPMIPILLVVAMLAGACSPNPAEALETNKTVVRRVHDELWSQGDFAAIGDLISAEFVGHAPVGPDWLGLEQVRERIEAHRTTFPDWHEQVEDLVAEGDLVAVRFTSTGTDRGGFLGHPPTGRHVRIREFAIYRLEGAKVVEQWVLPDLLALQQQLGLIPQAETQ